MYILHVHVSMRHSNNRYIAKNINIDMSIFENIDTEGIFSLKIFREREIHSNFATFYVKR